MSLRPRSPAPAAAARLPDRIKVCPRCGAGYLPETSECESCQIALGNDCDIDVLDVQVAETVHYIDGSERRQPPQKLPDRLKVCPECGGAVSAILTVCPDCKTRLSLEPDIAITACSGIENPQLASGSGLTLWWLFAVMTAIAVVLAIGSAAPPLGVLAGLVMLPSMILTYIQVREREVQGHTVPTWERLRMFIIASGLTLGVILLGVVGIVVVLAVLLSIATALFRL